MATPSPDERPVESVGSVAALYLGNILSDLCVALVDPRVKFGGSASAHG